MAERQRLLAAGPHLDIVYTFAYRFSVNVTFILQGIEFDGTVEKLS